MTPWFVLSAPRSRTAWLSVFLTGAGVPCFHEAWAQVKTAKQLRTLMESKGDGPVVNSDCSNVFFFEELRVEFPTAQYIRIEQADETVIRSLTESYGGNGYQEMLQCYRRANAQIAQRQPAAISLDCDTWDRAESARVYRAITGTEVDAGWLTQVSGMLVQLMPETIADQLAMGRTGALTHISRRMAAA